VTCIQFNYANFVQYYAQFNNSVAYPEQTLQLYWDEATTYISNNIRSGGLSIPQRTRAINLMTAHLAVLNGQAQAGQQTGLVQGATIDKISIQLTPPPEVDQWQWWLNQTQYGQQLLALFQVAAAGGFFVGGFPTVNTLRR
jgi:Protein of unknown function (DUF4054)